MSEVPRLSVVIPAYNEADRLPVWLNVLLPYLRRQGYASEIVVVDDGSTDRTSEVAASFSTPELPVRVLRHEPNQGKGYSVKAGVAGSLGAHILFCDADGSTDLSALEGCWQAAVRGARVVIGSRNLPTSTVVRHQPWLRRRMGIVFRWISNRILLRPVSDITCGFKFFEAAAARAIFPQLRVTQWAFDAEALFLAQYLGYAVAEVPVIWTNDERTRVRLSVDAWQSFVGLLQIRWNAWRGRYHRTGS